MASHKQHFLQFLKENNAYEEFMFNFESKEGRFYRANRGLLCPTEKYFTSCYSRSYLRDAFLWNDTSQKHDYWSSLNKKWFELWEIK